MGIKFQIKRLIINLAEELGFRGTWFQYYLIQSSQEHFYIKKIEILILQMENLIPT